MDLFKEFFENILSGKIKYNDIEYYEKGFNNIGKDLNYLKKSKKVDKLKYYIKKKLFIIWKR